jgi:DNA-binding LytR/AlgR family response regulator
MGDVDRVLLHLSGRRRVPVDPGDVYYLEADGDETLLRRRGARRLRDVRSLGEVLPHFEPHGFRRVHRNHAVNVRRVREIRPRKNGVDWELKLEAPVNRVLPVSRASLPGLLAAYERKTRG